MLRRRRVRVGFFLKKKKGRWGFTGLQFGFAGTLTLELVWAAVVQPAVGWRRARGSSGRRGDKIMCGELGWGGGRRYATVSYRRLGRDRMVTRGGGTAADERF